MSVKNAGLAEISKDNGAVPSESMGIKTAEMKLSSVCVRSTADS